MTRYFTEDHEWIEIEGTIATIGITDFAQEQLGDIVFVELPAIGTEITRGEEAAVVESVKAASDVFSPVTGTVSEANSALEDEPSLANGSPETDGWFFKVEMSEAGEVEGLMDESAYQAFVADLD